jgi:hypothetical protein
MIFFFLFRFLARVEFMMLMAFDGMDKGQEEEGLLYSLSATMYMSPLLHSAGVHNG